jgi:hypothetical protein
MQAIDVGGGGFCLWRSVAHQLELLASEANVVAYSQSRVDQLAAQLQIDVVNHLQAMCTAEWISMWGQDFTIDQAREIITSHNGWLADHPLADQLVQIVANTVEANFEMNFAFDIYNDDVQEVRRVGSGAPGAVVANLVLKEQHYRSLIPAGWCCYLLFIFNSMLTTPTEEGRDPGEG